MQLNHDELIQITDDDLDRRFFTVKSLIETKKLSKKKLKELQVEYCYLSREKDMRIARRRLHDEYMKNNKPRRKFNTSKPQRPNSKPNRNHERPSGRTYYPQGSE